VGRAPAIPGNKKGPLKLIKERPGQHKKSIYHHKQYTSGPAAFSQKIN
jgi:hypothetical protein